MRPGIVGTLNGGLYRMRARTLERVDLPREIESVFGIEQDGAGALWLTTNVGIARMLGEQVHVFGTDDGFPPRGFYRAIVAAHDGGVVHPAGLELGQAGVTGESLDVGQGPDSARGDGLAHPFDRVEIAVIEAHA